MKILFQKILTLGLILAALGITYYLYQKGEISFFSGKKDAGEIQSQIIEVPFTGKEYKLSYEDTHKDKSAAGFDITNFENNENWFGDGDFDFSTYFEGEASLFLSSFNSQKVSVRLKKNFDIKEVLNFKFLVHLETDPAYIEEFNLIFTLNSSREYKFSIRDLREGWNILVLPKESFSSFVTGEEKGDEAVTEVQTKEVRIELISRPKVRSIVHLDSLWAEKEKDYLEDWNLNSENFLALKKNENTTSLLAINLTDNRATLRKGSGKDYTFKGKFTPTKGGDFGFFLRGDYKTGYGYYLVMNGVGTNGWQIYKYGLFGNKVQTINLAKGETSNLKIGENKAYWLKADLKGRRIVFYFSQDNNNFVKLGEIEDNSFTSGGIGITASGGNMVFIDDLQFLQ